MRSFVYARRAACLLAAFAAAAGAALVHSATAAAESCAYDAATRVVTASITPGSAATVRVVGGEIWFGFAPVACGGATTANTDRVSVNGSAGSTERVVFDHAGGWLPAGAVALGDSADRLVVVATDDRNSGGATAGFLSMGVFGSSSPPWSATFAPADMELEVDLRNGDDSFTARPTQPFFAGRLIAHGGAGNDSFTGNTAADEFYGGDGDDLLQGQEGSDVLDGGPDNDTIRRQGGDDTMTGGTGVDSLTGSDGADTFYAADGVADTLLSAGPGVDTAY